MANWWEDIVGKQETTYDNTVLSDKGFESLQPGDWEGQLTGEQTTSTLLDAILTASGVGGMLAKSRKGLQLIPKKAWDKVFGPKLGKELALAMKGKIKQGKLVTDQPFRHGTIGKSVPKINKSDLDRVLLDILSAPKSRRLGRAAQPSFNLPKEGIKVPGKAPSFDIGGWKTPPGGVAQIAKKEGTDRGRAGIIGLLGLLGLLGTGDENYDEDGVSLLEGLTSGGAGDEPRQEDLLRILREQLGADQGQLGADPDYYEGDTPVSPEELAKIIQGEGEEGNENWNIPQHLSKKAPSWAR